MISKSVQQNIDTRNSEISHPFPFEIAFDNDASKTKLDIIASNTEGNIIDSIIRSTISIKLLFIPSRKARLPFIQEGEIALIDHNGRTLTSQSFQGLLETLRFNFNANNELTRKLIEASNETDHTLSIAYRFKCYDVWERTTLTFTNSISIFYDLKRVLNRNSNYYYIDQSTPRLNPFFPSKHKKSHRAKNVIHLSNINTAHHIKPNHLGQINANLLTLNTASVVKPEIMHTALLANFNVIKKEYHPKVNNIKSNFWVDYKYRTLYWVKPDFTIKRPGRGTAFNVSPFQFSFKKIGMMPDGSSALEGKLKLTITRFLNANWASKIPKNKKRKLIKSLDTSYKIRLPYIDAKGKRNSTFLYASSSKVRGKTIHLEFTVSNEWLRLLYAALSVPDLDNGSRASLVVGYTFNAMVKPLQISNFLISGVHIGHLSAINRLNTFKIQWSGQIKNTKASYITRRSSAKPQFISANAASLTLANTNAIAAAVSTSLEKKYVLKKSHLTKKIPLVFNCTTYGDYYAEEKNGNLVAIGCNEPMRIGQITHALYSKIDDLSSPNYDVFKSNAIPQLFVVVPKRYILSRRQEDPEKFAPELFLHGAIDIEDYSNSLCLIDLKLEPDITFYERLILEKELKNYTAYEPQLKYITEVDGEETLSWNLSGSIIENANTYAFSQYIRGTFETNISNSQLCKSLLENTGMTGLYTKQLDEDLTVRVQLIVSLDHIAQPWLGEGITIETQQEYLKLSNSLESPIYIDRLYNSATNDRVFILVQNHLSTGETMLINSTVNPNDLIPIFSIQTSQQTLSESYSYIEDLFQQIICFDFLTNDDFGELLEVYIGCRDNPPYVKVEFNDDSPHKEIDLFIPIDEIISSSRFGYYIKYKTKEGNIIESNWIPHSFSTEGNIINITKQLII